MATELVKNGFGEFASLRILDPFPGDVAAPLPELASLIISAALGDGNSIRDAASAEAASIIAGLKAACY